MQIEYIFKYLVNRTTNTFMTQVKSYHKKEALF